MFKDEFESIDPTKIPLRSQDEVDELVKGDVYGDGLDPEERKLQRYDTKVPILQVQDSAKFANASQQ